MVGTGAPRDTWARKLHAAQANVPLVEALLNDLKDLAKTAPPQGPAPSPSALPQVSTPAPQPQRTVAAAPRASVDKDWRQRAFERE
jgi:hypothetical protein